MAGETLRERPPEVVPKPPLPRLEEIRPVRATVREEVGRQEKLVTRMMTDVYGMFDKQIAASRNPELQKAWNGSSLKTLLG